MFAFWFLLFCAQPQFLILGALGAFGKTAKEAADTIFSLMAMVVILGIIVGVPAAIVYFALHAFGVV